MLCSKDDDSYTIQPPRVTPWTCGYMRIQIVYKITYTTIKFKYTQNLLDQVKVITIVF